MRKTAYSTCARLSSTRTVKAWLTSFVSHGEDLAWSPYYSPTSSVPMSSFLLSKPGSPCLTFFQHRVHQGKVDWFTSGTYFFLYRRKGLRISGQGISLRSSFRFESSQSKKAKNRRMPQVLKVLFLIALE